MKEYVIKRVEGLPEWDNVPIMRIDHQRGENKDGVSAQAQLCWDDSGIHVRLSAREKHIRRRASIILTRGQQFFYQILVNFVAVGLSIVLDKENRHTAMVFFKLLLPNGIIGTVNTGIKRFGNIGEQVG